MSGGTPNARVQLALGAMLALAILFGPGPSRAQSGSRDGHVWVRDEIRINMRAGAGDRYKILRTLTSGAVLRVMGQDGEWLYVSTDKGEQGWVPSRYVSRDMPPSVALPLAEAERRAALESVETLKVKLASLESASAELEAVRARNQILEAENASLTRADRTRQLMIGAGIAFLGIVVGIFWRPVKGANSLATSKRLKL